MSDQISIFIFKQFFVKTTGISTSPVQYIHQRNTHKSQTKSLHNPTPKSLVQQGNKIAHQRNQNQSKHQRLAQLWKVFHQRKHHRKHDIDHRVNNQLTNINFHFLGAGGIAAGLAIPFSKVFLFNCPVFSLFMPRN
jgi:hypothetical protein